MFDDEPFASFYYYCYTRKAITWLLALPIEKMKHVVASLLHHIVKTLAPSDEYNNWITMKLKRSIDIKCPDNDAIRFDAFWL